MINIIYLNGYAEKEAGELSNLGASVYRINAPLDVASLAGCAKEGARALLRGPKIRPSEYGDLCNTLNVAGILPTTTVSDYSFASDSSAYEDVISEFVPQKMVFSTGDINACQNGLGALDGWGRVFIRSELGSAAKYSGIESCIIDSFEEKAIGDKIRCLMQAYPAAQTVIARRVENVRRIGEQSVEGRFVVVDGKLRYMDHCEIYDANIRSEFEERNILNAQAVASRFSSVGIGGDYFVDIAEKADGGWFVVEIKPLLNGTIRDIGQFWNSMSAV